MKIDKHYQIRKRVICDLVDGECIDERDISCAIKPICKDCRYYKEWKETGMDLKSYLQKLQKTYVR